MPLQRAEYSRSPEVLLVGLARKGDRDAFAELTRRRQHWIRNLMRRCCGDATLADDLAQQAFLQAWRSIHNLRRSGRFAPWLKRLAVNTWLQHTRKQDPLRYASDIEDTSPGREDQIAKSMDLDQALATLPGPARLCIVMSYHERMTHEEIADLTGFPLGTVKSHIRRGTAKLQKNLSAYRNTEQEQ